MTKRLPRRPNKNEESIVAAVEEHWYRHHLFPSLAIIGKVTGLKYETVKTLIRTPVTTIMLENRGIPPYEGIEHRLSPDQLAAANCYLNFADTRPMAQKLKDLGISSTKFGGWMKGKAFQAYITERAEELFEDGMAVAHRELLGQVSKGNIRAIQLFYEVSGRYMGVQSIEAQNIGILMTRLLEAIQMEVSDPQVIARIGERFKILAAGGTQTIPQGIPQEAPAVEERKTPLAGIIERQGSGGSL